MGDKRLTDLAGYLAGILDFDKRYLAAVSGGADSLALAQALLESGADFAVCHVEHGIRGKASLGDASFVKDFCKERGIEFYLKSVNAPALAAKKGISLEEAARDLRYEALCGCAKDAGADFILTAHHRDDQAETLLLNLLRGSGTSGLAAMRQKNGNIIRPLLDVPGEDLRRYLSGRGIAWREDATNLDEKYVRNKIRLRLLPYLKEEFNPNIVETLCRTADNLRQDDDFIEDMADWEFARRFLGEEKRGAMRRLTLDASFWDRLPEALHMRLIRLLWRKTGKEHDLLKVHYRAVEDLASCGASGKKIMLPEYWQAMYEYGKLILLYEEERSEDDAEGGVLARVPWDKVPGEDQKALLVKDPLTQRILLVQKCLEKPEFEPRREGIYPLPAAMEEGSALEIRRRRTGDTLRLYSGLGHKSLKKFLSDEKMPREQRKTQLVAASGSTVLFLPSFANVSWEEKDDHGPWLYFSAGD